MHEIIHIDQQLLLLLNSNGVGYWDRLMMLVTETWPWIPMAVGLLVVLLRRKTWRQALVIVLLMALVITVCDQFASSVCKPLFHRLRPSHEPALEGLVCLPDGAHGLYGFISSHAANTFGVFAFTALLLRRRAFVLTMLCWACLSSYSRIYLGLHYPGDILAGALWGLLVGWGVWHLVPADARVGYARGDALWPTAIFWITLGLLLVAAAFKLQL